MRKKISFVILGSSGAPAKQVCASKTSIHLFGLVLIAFFAAVGYIVYDYYNLRVTTSHLQNREVYLSSQLEEIQTQRKQIQEFANEINGDTFGYGKFTVDLRRYLNLFYDRVVVLGMRVEITDNLQNKQIPFYQLAGLGGQNSLRGYRPVRFRDRDLFLTTLEYRWPVHSMAIAYGFFEEGRIFSNVFDEFSFDEFKYSFGGGLRLKSRDGGLIAIFEIAKSREQLRFNVGLNKDLREF